MTSPRVLTATLATLLAGVSVAGCTAKESATTEQGTAPGAQVTVNASDTACELSAREGAAGPTTFIVTNNGAKATEFYVYGKDNRVLAEVEDWAPPDAEFVRHLRSRMGELAELGIEAMDD